MPLKDDAFARTLQDWHDAETSGDDAAADRAFAEAYSAMVPRPAPSSGFAEQAVAAIAVVVDRDARRARLIRRGLGWLTAGAAVALLYLGSGLLFSVFSAAIIEGLNLLVSTIVWFAEGGSARTGVWTTFGGLSRAAAAFVAEPRVTVAILVFQAAAAGALVVMHRLLGRGREWVE